MASILQNKEQLAKICKVALNQKQALELLGLRAAGGNFTALKSACKKFDIELPFEEPKDRAKRSKRTKIPLSEILVENSTYSRTHLKRRLFEEGILQNICNRCGQPPWWNNEPLTLQLEHINGIYDDNRLFNLEILCGHCHSQTKTFAGRNCKKLKFCKCGKQIAKNSNKCRTCAVKRERINTRKVPRPSREELEKLVWQMPTSHLAKNLGVSDVAIGKWCKSYGITKPPRGYWTNKHWDVV